MKPLTEYLRTPVTIIGTMLAFSAAARSPQAGGVTPAKEPQHSGRIAETQPRQYNSSGRPNLCRLDQGIFIGTVESRSSSIRQLPNATVEGIVTDVEFYVERRIVGDIPPSRIVSLQVRGGEVAGRTQVVTGYPTLPTGSRYLLFVNEWHNPGRIGIHAFYRLPSDGQLSLLPSERDLFAVWSATCAEHPDGIYYRGPRVDLVLPQEVINRYDDWRRIVNLPAWTPE
jgi:hypothetical protein